MKRNLKRNKSKMKSKRGMTLLELIVGLTIVVIVFSSTLGAMVSGYTTTVYNADENRASVFNSSLNEIVFNSFQKVANETFDDQTASYTFYNVLSTEFEHFYADESYSVTSFAGMSESDATKMSTYARELVQFINKQMPEAVFVATVVAPDGSYTANFTNNESYQYAFIPGSTTNITVTSGGTTTEIPIQGVTIRTCFMTARGQIISESFVPYSIKYKN